MGRDTGMGTGMGTGTGMHVGVGERMGIGRQARKSGQAGVGILSKGSERLTLVRYRGLL